MTVNKKSGHGKFGTLSDGQTTYPPKKKKNISHFILDGHDEWTEQGHVTVVFEDKKISVVTRSRYFTSLWINIVYTTILSQHLNVIKVDTLGKGMFVNYVKCFYFLFGPFLLLDQIW